MKETDILSKSEEIRINNIKDSHSFSPIKKLFTYEETDSTNDRAKDYIKSINEGSNLYANEKNGEYSSLDSILQKGVTAFFADYQTKGRGKINRKWHMEKGKDLAFSIVISTDMEITQIPKITLIAGEAVIAAIKEIYGASLKLKWPNDVVYKRKKLCGILTEMKKSSSKYNGKDIYYIIIGIGINCNTEAFPEELGNIAISLKNILISEGHNKQDLVDRMKLFNKVVQKLWDYYNEFYKTGLNNFMDSIKSDLEYISDKVKINKNNMTINATVQGINDEGMLIISTEDGKNETVISGEIDEWGYCKFRI